MNRDEIKFVRNAINEIADQYQQYNLLTDEIYEHLQMCYKECVIPDMRYLSTLTNQHLREEVKEWLARNKDD